MENANFGQKIKKVLVIDDDQQMGNMLTRYLNRYNYEVHRAVTGNEAIQISNLNQDLDLILSDVNFPAPTDVEFDHLEKYSQSLLNDDLADSNASFVNTGGFKTFLAIKESGIQAKYLMMSGNAGIYRDGLNELENSPSLPYKIDGYFEKPIIDINVVISKIEKLIGTSVKS